MLLLFIHSVVYLWLELHAHQSCEQVECLPLVRLLLVDDTLELPPDSKQK